MRVTGLEKREARWTIRWVYRVLPRVFGKMLTPYTVMARQPRALFGSLVANICIESAKGIPDSLKRIVCLRAAQLIGCPF